MYQQQFLTPYQQQPLQIGGTLGLGYQVVLQPVGVQIPPVQPQYQWKQPILTYQPQPVQTFQPVQAILIPNPVQYQLEAKILAEENNRLTKSINEEKCVVEEIKNKIQYFQVIIPLSEGLNDLIDSNSSRRRSTRSLTLVLQKKRRVSMKKWTSL